MITEIIGHTPVLLDGLLINFLISSVAMGSGTLIGFFVGNARNSHKAAIRQLGQLVNNLCRNIPSFVLMFYMAFLIPIEIVLPWQLSLSAPFFIEQNSIFSVSPWLKGSLALTIPVIGFSGDLFYSHQQNRQWRDMRSQKEGFAHLLESWVNYFLIIIMASATASVIGIQEILGVANNIIAARPDAIYFRLWLYLYVATWFLILGTLVNLLLNLLHKTLAKNAKLQAVEKPQKKLRRTASRIN